MKNFVITQILPHGTRKDFEILDEYIGPEEKGDEEK